MKKKSERKREPYYCDSRGSWVLPLTQGLEALIDESDVPLIGQYKWFANNVTKKNRKTVFVYPCSKIPGSRSYSYLHRFLMQPKNGFIIDHLNGNTLDNRRANLRICTLRENNCNLKIHRTGAMLGAHKTPYGTYISQIKIDGKTLYLGSFKTAHEAHQAYMAAYNDYITQKKSAA